MQPILTLNYFQEPTDRTRHGLTLSYGSRIISLWRFLPHHDAAYRAACVRRLDNAARWRLVRRFLRHDPALTA